MTDELIYYLVSMPKMKKAHGKKRDTDRGRHNVKNKLTETDRQTQTHTCKYHRWAAKTKRFLKGHPGCWAKLQGSYTPIVICEEKRLSE